MAWASLDFCSSSTPRSAVVVSSGAACRHLAAALPRLALLIGLVLCSEWALSVDHREVWRRQGYGEYYQTGHVLALLIKLSNHCINKEIQSNISRNHHQNLSPPTPLLQNSTNIVKTSTHLRQLTTISFLYGRTDHPERLYRRPSHGAIFISGLIA